jgi:hypothetical protein
MPWMVTVKRVAAAALLGGTGVAWGVITLRLQEHYAALAAGGDDLNPIAQLFADGSGPRTAWLGWAASVLFLVAVLRLRLGPPEPPVGRPKDGNWTATEMRAALRTEYHFVRIAFRAVGVLAGIDAGRAAVYVVSAATGSSTAQGNWEGTAVEALGLVVGAALLGLWLVLFMRLLGRWGAL